VVLGVVAKAGRDDGPGRDNCWLDLGAVMFSGGLLIYGTFDMPYFGSAQAPAQVNETTSHYIDDSLEEIGIPNIVTSVLASYRAFDTFGEVVVIFTAGIGILALLSAPRRRKNEAELDAINQSMHEQHMVLRIMAKILIPFILIFALYVQFHGEYGPGGGFQAGVIFAAAIILYSMLFGMDTARQVINQAVIRFVAALGVLVYGSVGIVSFLNGGNFLDYNVLADNPITGQHLGIIVIELGVGLTVTAVMIIIFFNFAERNASTLPKATKGE